LKIIEISVPVTPHVYQRALRQRKYEEPEAKISEYQMPNDQKSLNDQKKYAKQLGQLFFSKISYNFTIKLI